KVSQYESNVEKSKKLPDIILGFSSQTYKGLQTINGINRDFTGKNRFNFFQIGLGLPLLPGGYKSRLSAMKINEQIAQNKVELNTSILSGKFNELILLNSKFQKELNYYSSQALPQANLIIVDSEKKYQTGEISYSQLLQNYTLVNGIRTRYLEILYNYNKVIISIESLNGNQ
ncbi:MAG TPA: TolC family protein, partial [Sediminibacterium sp.]